jgi:hypothetical protein
MVNTAVVAALFVLFAGVNGAAQTATGSPAKPDEVATLSKPGCRLRWTTTRRRLSA